MRVRILALVLLVGVAAALVGQGVSPSPAANYQGRVYSNPGYVPTVAGTGFGTTPTLAVAAGSSDYAGVINATPGGTGIAAVGTLTITFSTTAGGYTLSSNPACVVTLGNNTGTWNARATAIQGTPSNTQLAVNWDNNAVALTTGVIYRVCWVCVGK